MRTMDEKKLNLEILLKEIEDLKNDHSNQEEFNAFQIFRLNDKEVMHSRFIKSLLNPAENHGYNEKFLELFLQQVKINKFNTQSVTSECEKNTHNNRYIDISIENQSSRQMIIIENKIWAGDLDNQLLDYYEYGLKLYGNKSENIFMIYLTPYGKQYGNNSFPRDKEQPKNGIKCISYEKDILKWLHECLKHIGNKGNRLFLCIEMYIELIRKTINRDKYMEEILKHLVNNPSQMKAAINLVKTLQGRNFLEINSETRNLILKNIESIIKKEPYFGKLKHNNNGTHNFCDFKNTKTYFVFEKDCIYGELYDDDDDDYKISKPFEISGYDLNNKYLVALLINDTDLIEEWINKTINYLIGEAENI